MFIVGFLLSPIGEESKTRADAGISFICKSLELYQLRVLTSQSCSWSRSHSVGLPCSKLLLSSGLNQAKSSRGLYPAEVLTFENRAKGLSLQSWVTSLCSLINTFGLPPALKAISYISKF